MNIDEPSKFNTFQPTFKVNLKTCIVIIAVLGIIAAIPFIVNYIQNPEKRTPKEIIAQTVEDFTPEIDPEGDQLILTIPFTSLSLNLTVFKQNPQLIMYAGGGFLLIAGILFIALTKNFVRRRYYSR